MNSGNTKQLNLAKKEIMSCEVIILKFFFSFFFQNKVSLRVGILRQFKAVSRFLPVFFLLFCFFLFLS